MQCVYCGSQNIESDNQNDIFVCNKCHKSYKKEYFFISHSHKDIEKVRIVRNTIEESFYNEPILFFLKCLEDDNEITSLLKREIDARLWFIYCNSKNADASKYVQEERKYVQSLIDKGINKNIVTIDLDKFSLDKPDEIKKFTLRQIKKRFAFISYNQTDIQYANQIYNDLTNIGCNTYCIAYHNYDIENEFGLHINNTIQNIAKNNGYFIILLSKKSLSHNFVKYEYDLAVKNNCIILPVLIDLSFNDEELMTKFPIFQNTTMLKYTDNFANEFLKFNPI